MTLAAQNTERRVWWGGELVEPPYLVLSPPWNEPPPEASRVLFVGNSHAQYHSLGAQLQHLALSQQRPRALDVIDASVPPTELAWHTEHGALDAALAQGGLSAVVLQERSLLPLEDLGRHTHVVRKITAQARAHGVRVLLHVHWPRAPWVRLYRSEPSLVGSTPDEMAQRSLAAAQVVARECWGLEPVPVAQAWIEALRCVPAKKLYYRGGNHASLAGAYLTASVYALFFCGSVGGKWLPPGLSPSLASVLRGCARRAVTREVRASTAPLRRSEAW